MIFNLSFPVTPEIYLVTKSFSSEENIGRVRIQINFIAFKVTPAISGVIKIVLVERSLVMTSFARFGKVTRRERNREKQKHQEAGPTPWNPASARNQAPPQ